MNALENWTNGVPLNEADLRFAPRRLKTKYRAAQLMPSPELKDEAHSGAPAWIRENPAARSFSAFGEFLRGTLNARTAHWDVRFEMQGWLLAQLAHGQFEAYGYHIPADSARHPQDIPVQVPLDILDKRHVDWGNSTIDGGGLKFVSVRVIRRHDTNGKEAIAQSAPIPHVASSEQSDGGAAIPAPKPRPGRPGYGHEITDTYERLQREGAIDYSAPMSSAIALIRERLPALHPNSRAAQRQLDDETIRKRIAHDFNKQSAAKKSSKL